jgi:hypothetical protein
LLRRLLTISALVGVLAVALALPAGARDGSRHTDSGGRIVVEGGTTVAASERVSKYLVSIDGDVRIEGIVGADVYVVDGDLHLSGKALDDVVVVGGDAVITGRINDNLVVIGGRAILRAGGVVVGDVSSSDAPRIAKGAAVGGAVKDLDLGGVFQGILFKLLAFIWLSVTVSTALLGLLVILFMPRTAEAAAASGRRLASSIATGVVVGVVGPVAVFLTVVSLVGLPFGFGLGGALLAISGLGYVTSSLSLGRLMIKRPGRRGRLGAFFAGFGILRALALVPVVGFVVWLAATIYGIGALVNAAWRSGRRASSDDDAPAASEPVPPAPETDEPTDEAPTATVSDERGPDASGGEPADAPVDDAQPAEISAGQRTTAPRTRATERQATRGAWIAAVPTADGRPLTS